MHNPFTTALGNLRTCPQFFMTQKMEKVFSDPSYYERYEVWIDGIEQGVYTDAGSAFYSFLKNCNQVSRGCSVDAEINLIAINEEHEKETSSYEPITLLTNC